MESEVKIRKSILERYIKDFSNEINHMQDVSLPEVIFELQAEELDLLGIKFSKEEAERVCEFSIENIEFVFHCWMMSDDGEDWLENLIAEEESARLVAGLIRGLQKNGGWFILFFY